MGNVNGTASSPGVTLEQLMAERAQLLAEKAQLEASNARLEALAAQRGPKVSGMKVSDKGGLSVYGLQRFPVTLYKAQWMALLAAAPEIAAYIKANSHLLTDKQADA